MALFGLLGGGSEDDDPYKDILTPGQRNQMLTQGLLAMAGAFADAGMPSRLPIPFGAALGKAAAALGTGQEAGMKAAIENALAAQKVRDLRNLSQFRNQFFGDQDKINDAIKQILAPGGGAAPAGRSPAVAPARTYVGPGGASAPADAPLTVDRLPYPDTAGGGLLGGGDTDLTSGLSGNIPSGGSGADTDLRNGKPKAMRALPRDQPGSGGGLLGEGSGGGSSPADLGAGGDDATPIWNPTFPQAADRGAPASGDPLDIIAKYESGGRNIMQQVLGPQGGYNPSVGRVTGPSSASGPWQMIDSTWRDAARKTGVDTQQYPTAISAPVDVQRAVAQTLYDEQGYAPWAPYNRNLAQAVGYTGGRGPGATIAGSGGSTEPDAYQSLTPTRGGQPPAAPGPLPPQMAAPGAPQIPQIPVPPGVDPAKFNALLLELARRNAAAEVLGMGNPYGSMLSVLQGSPQYQGAIETAKRGAGLPFVEPEAEAKARGGQMVDLQARAYQASLDRVTAQLKTEGEAANTIQEGGILVSDGKGGTQRIQATRKQAIMAANGLAVPELGIPGLVKPSGSGSDAGQSGSPAAGTPAGKPELSPGQAESQKTGVAAGWKALEDTHAGELAANRRDQQLGQLAEAMQGFTPGATADLRVKGQAILRDLRLIKGDEVPSAETFQRAARQLQITAAPKGQGSVSNYERELYGEAVVSLANTPEGVAKAIDIARRLDQYDRNVAQIHRDVAKENNGTPNLIEAQQRIARLGPPLSAGEINSLEQIRAGKVPGPGQAVGQPAAGAPERRWNPATGRLE